MNIWLDEENVIAEETLRQLDAAAQACLEAEGLDPEQLALSLTFVTEEEIRELNREHRDTDRVTDVLSFPMFEGAEEIRQTADMSREMEIPLGDVVICREMIRRQADEYGHSETRELVYLFVHSVLHLLGYDHMEDEDKAEMRRREEQIMEQLGIPR